MIVTQKIFHIQRQLVSMKKHWSKQTELNPVDGYEQKMVGNFFGDARTDLAVPDVDYVEPKTINENKQSDD